MQIAGYDIDILVQGFPGKTVCHGGLGWSTVALLKGRERAILVDCGPFNMRRVIAHQLGARGMSAGDITDVLLSHAHYDHAINWPMFPNARIVIGDAEMDWAAAQPIGHPLVPEFTIAELKRSPRLHIAKEGEEVAPALFAHVTPGHTPGSLVYVLKGETRDVVFTGDAAKNRAEMLTRKADLTMDAAASSASIGRIWHFWARREESLLVPGHDIPMVLKGGAPRYIEGRRAGLTAFFGDDLDTVTLFELSTDKAPAVQAKS